MSFYLGIYWIFLFLYLLLLGIAYFTKAKKFFKFLIDYGHIILIINFSILIVAFMTNDPLFGPLGVPKEYEWLAALITSGFGLWQFYLNPLKERVITTEREVSSIKTDVSAIRGDVGIIKNKIINNKIKE